MSARFVTAVLAMGRLADDLTAVMRAVIVGSPSRAVARRDFELPGPVVLERGDVATLVGCPAGLDRNAGVAVIERASTRAGQLDTIVEAVQIGAITRETGAELIAEMSLSPGLVPCPTCSTEQAARDGHMAVHFATREATRPCPSSWPAKVVRR